MRGALDLDRAIRLALEHSPSFSERVWSARAELNRARDEALAPNPTLDLTLENFGGSLGSGHAERTATLGQPLRLGGLGGARRSVVGALERMGRTDLDAARREVAIQTGNTFLDAWWLERRFARLERAEAIAASAIEAAKERTRIGAAPVVESLRARALRAATEIERRRTGADLDIARLRLAMQWGAAEATFDSLVLPAPTSADLPSLDSLTARLYQRPELRRATAETAVAAARMRAARTERFPEPTVSGGVRRFDETDETGFLVGLSVPVPIWNRGGARHAAAVADYQAALARERMLQITLRQDLAGSYRRLIAARDDYETARTEAQPAANQALEQLGAGYRAGRFTYLDYIEGQRAALEIELSTLDAIREYWSATFALEWGVGADMLPPPIDSGTKPGGP